MRVLRHVHVFSSPYDVFAVSIETRRWGFGVKVADWRDPSAAKAVYGLRVLVWRWHLCWRLT